MLQTPAKMRDCLAAGPPGQPAESGPAYTRYETAARRPLCIFAFDPMLGRSGDHKITIDVATEDPDLAPGPCGRQVQVSDYDSSVGCYYRPVNLNEPALLMQEGPDRVALHGSAPALTQVQAGGEASSHRLR